ncbi:MAG: CRISPR-associated protein Csx19 [Anaerolineales bacterium]|jgi:CRISPR-associated protein (TIGR03984 family)|nr:CRISPR-associated protein Csx19 [Anaerolineales bacterium]
MSGFIKTDVSVPESGKLQTWLTEQMGKYGQTLLAFADDGVIWGSLANGILQCAPEAPALREITLQQAFVFGAECEVRLFRDEKGDWQALRVVDGDDPELVIKESLILWGNEALKPAKDGFIYASEYRAGIPGQCLPLAETFGPEKCARLEVHHLVEVDPDTGESRIAASRLAGLTIGDRAMEVEK